MRGKVSVVPVSEDDKATYKRAINGVLGGLDGFSPEESCIILMLALRVIHEMYGVADVALMTDDGEVIRMPFAGRAGRGNGCIK